jgi:hypothetical protein
MMAELILNLHGFICFGVAALQGQGWSMTTTAPWLWSTLRDLFANALEPHSSYGTMWSPQRRTETIGALASSERVEVAALSAILHENWDGE